MKFHLCVLVYSAVATADPESSTAKTSGSQGGDYQKYMDYSKYTGGAGGQGGDYQKYMDYSKYMSQGSETGDKKGNGPASDYQQYMDYSKYMSQGNRASDKKDSGPGG